ncbi:MAG: hypothetical protein PHP95_15625 [Desulfuromonadaceae bacterium]|nr:hypothetical protein [Desulfuromonadaceae bacterium]MDD2849881.1 hypothetical protein [Desulfuromonadaceae bacterium]MDD4130696.1 hypothetical protein [Desulfuromonadaceae bacterium]
MRRSLQFLLFIAVSLAVFLSLPLHARHQQRLAEAVVKPQAAQLRSLHVTDLCLATEARYTRHPAVADRHAAFQDHPLALEHFPSGSLILPTTSARTKP